MKVMYDVNEVIAAAKYLAENNTKLNKDSQEIFDCIVADIIKFASDADVAFVGTGGYLLTFDQSDDTLFVDIYISPSFDEGFYITMEL